MGSSGQVTGRADAIPYSSGMRRRPLSPMPSVPSRTDAGHVGPPLGPARCVMKFLSFSTFSVRDTFAVVAGLPLRVRRDGRPAHEVPGNERRALAVGAGRGQPHPPGCRGERAGERPGSAPRGMSRRGGVKSTSGSVRGASTRAVSWPKGGFLVWSEYPFFFLSGAHDGRRGLRRHHDRGLRAGGLHRQGGGQAVTAENIVGLLVAAALLGYLVLALVKPERF